MTKDRERVEDIRATHKTHGKICTINFLLSLIDKQDKVVETARNDHWGDDSSLPECPYAVCYICNAIKALDGGKD